MHDSITKGKYTIYLSLVLPKGLDDLRVLPYLVNLFTESHWDCLWCLVAILNSNSKDCTEFRQIGTDLETWDFAQQ